MLTPKQPAIRIDYVYHGTKEDAQSALQPFLDLEPIYKKEEYINWAELPWVTYGGLNNVLCNAPGGQKNVYAASAETYDLSAMLSLWTAWEKMAKKYEGKVNLLIMFQTFSQGAIRDFDSDGSAFPWRYGSKHFLWVFSMKCYMLRILADALAGLSKQHIKIFPCGQNLISGLRCNKGS